MTIFSTTERRHQVMGIRARPAAYIEHNAGKHAAAGGGQPPVGENKTVLVVHLPPVRNNPYQKLMFNSLRAHSVEASCAGGVGALQLLKQSVIGDQHVLHLHWISEPVVLHSLPVAMIRILVFQTSLLIWRLRNKRIVWTVHNLVNHERYRARLDKLNSRVVARIAHRLLVHGEGAKRLVALDFNVPESKIDIVLHGNYEGIMEFQPVNSRRGPGVRFAYFGLIRAYKGVPELIRAFSHVKGEHQLRIAGRPRSSDLHREVENESGKDERVSCLLRFISNDELARLLAWSDVVVLPYKAIMMSGSLLMALTAGRPVIAPRIGVIPEYVDESCAFLYEPCEPDGLSRALNNAVACLRLPDMARAAHERSQRFRWDDISLELARIYRKG